MNCSRVVGHHVSWFQDCCMRIDLIILVKVKNGLRKAKNLTAAVCSNVSKMTFASIFQAAVLFICSVNRKPKSYRFIWI